MIRFSSALATIGGLPLHPLIVHAAVVLLPLSVVGLLLVIFVRRWRQAYAWLATLGLLAGTAAALLSKESGEQLAASVGLPAKHAQYADYLVVASILLSAVAAIWWVAQHRSRSAEADGSATRVLGYVTALLTIPVLVLIVLVGHSGAQAAWGGRVASPQPTQSQTQPQSSPQPAQSAGEQPASGGDSTPTPSTAGTYTMADVQKHATAQSCWAAIDGGVYDLTAWIAQHPGGPGPIEQLCGTDAAAAFTAQHGNNGAAKSELASLQIGVLR